MSVVVRRYIPQAIVSAIILLMVAFYFLYISKPVSDKMTSADKALTDWGVIIAAFAAIVGGTDILRFHLNQIRRGGVRQAPFSSLTIAFELTMVILALYGLYLSYAAPELKITITTQPQFQWLYTYLYAPMDAAMYSILVFYIASASYRAFRVRNVMAGLLLVVAFLVMMGNTSLGALVWPGFLGLRDWIMTVPNTAAFRPITMGAGFGIVITGLRLLLWKEVSWLGRRE